LRLDWLMWFAALELTGGQEPSWLWNFLERLGEGSPPVLRLAPVLPWRGVLSEAIGKRFS